ncbi:abortive infection family protein [Chromobacterium haemolyticum]|uniref:abortive infection family protein n=1 Tax=Chromobacterium haemolyticum TaxID=394935 RepID=UPI004055372B
MVSLTDDLDSILATTVEMLVADGSMDAAALLRSADPQIEQTGYDNWNGGTTIWTLYLRIQAREYAHLGSRKEALESQIDKRLKPIVEQFSTDWVGVKVAPMLEEKKGWRQQCLELPRDARQEIVDFFRIEKISWSGVLDEVEFLQRLYDLEELPSTDSRFKTASGDIWQHRVNNPDDWPDDWIFSDHRFRLIDGPTEVFLRFLCEVVHPLVRPNRNDCLRLVNLINDLIQLHGWKLVEDEPLAGRPRFIPRQIKLSVGRSVSRARSVADALDAGWMQKEIERLERAVESDPALAIGTAKELVETCCKTILTKLNIEFGKAADINDLTKLLAKALKLVPEGISNEAKGVENVRLILRNLSALPGYLTELRGLYGTGHGRDGKHRGLEPRHARLAVGAAVVFIDFVTETFRQRSLTGQYTSRN